MPLANNTMGPIYLELCASLPRGEEDGGNATRGKFRYVSLIREGGMDKRHRRELSIYRGTKCKVE